MALVARQHHAAPTHEGAGSRFSLENSTAASNTEGTKKATKRGGAKEAASSKSKSNATHPDKANTTAKRKRAKTEDLKPGKTSGQKGVSIPFIPGCPELKME